MPKKDNIELSFPLHPKQKLLRELVLHSDKVRIGYGGARGGAKSHGVRVLGLECSYIYDVPVMIFRRLRHEVMNTHVYPLLRENPELRQYFNKSELILYHPNGYPAIQFGYAEYPDDIYNYLGAEFAVIFVDEATQCTQEMIEFLTTCVRDAHGRFPSKPKLVCTMNPGGIGHAYIKRLFIDRIYVDNEVPGRYEFIQSSVWDNVNWVLPELTKQGFTVDDYYNKWTEQERIDFTIAYSDYAENLMGLPPELVKAYLWGDWDIFGGMFFKGFEKSKQVVRAFQIPETWKLIGAIDPGFSSPCSFGLLAQDYDDCVYRIATYYESEKPAYQHAQSINEWLDSAVISKLTGGRRPEYIVSGKDAWARRDMYAITSSERTFADVFMEAGLPLVQANTDRIQGWWAFKSLFPDKFKVFEGLNNPLLEQMTAVVNDEKAVEDIQGRGNDRNVEDHAIDECRYGIMALYEPPEVKQEKKTYGVPRFGGALAQAPRKDIRTFW
jgi:phage terminase large subunit